MKITLYIPKTIFSTYSQGAINEYAKRLSRYCKIETREVSSLVGLSELSSDRQYCIGISPKYDTISSERLADTLQQLGTKGQSTLAFYLFDNVKKEEDSLVQESISQWFALSKMNLSMETVVTVLYEQIYRSFRIINNQAYHK